jgi:hypothetical protein
LIDNGHSEDSVCKSKTTRTPYTATPTFSQLGYTQTTSNDNYFYTINQTGSVTVTPIPEPVTLTLLAVGGVLTVIRRRRLR